jgi:N-acetylmuramoyl-L-alanine amidase
MAVEEPNRVKLRRFHRLALGAVLAGALSAHALAAAHAGDAPAAVRKASTETVAVANAVRVGGDDSRTRLVLDLSRTVELSAFTLADPYRVVVDLPQVSFSLPPKTGENGRGLIKAFRYGMVMPGGSRIVIDAAGPVRIDKAFVIDAVEDQPARLVLDLVAVDRDTFLRNLAVENNARRQSAAATHKSDVETPAPAGDGRPVVVLDPGHGGLDAGTTAPSGEAEKSIVLDFARMLREKLEKSGKYHVVMTRSDDSFIPLGERVRIARAHKASLFVSIHADTLGRRSPETRGATIYTLSENASDGEAATLAEAENKADVIAGVDLSAEPNDVADILIDLAQRETKSFSTNFAHKLVSELKSSARLHKHPLKSAGFKVLKAPDVPSVLVELGYVSNPQDLKLMTSDSWRRKVVDSIAQAITNFFAPRLAAGTTSKPSP